MDKIENRKKGMVNYNFDLMENILAGSESVTIQSPSELPACILKPGKAKGPLWGGNMCLLINRLGTPDQLNTAGAILFIEDIDEYLGDIVICLPIVIEEASEQEISVRDHFAHMVTHGVLHLIGYDHIESDEAEIMEGLESNILKQLEIANPYSEDLS